MRRINPFLSLLARKYQNAKGTGALLCKCRCYVTISLNESKDHTDSKAYTSHIPLTNIQQGILAVGSAFMALKDPTRADSVATLGETTGKQALRRMRRKMMADSVGQQILSERPVVNSATIDTKKLALLPDGTFGKEYTNFMNQYNLSADGRPVVQYVDDEELAFVMRRYRESHDFIHTLLGLPSISVPAEIAVKWFEMVQTGLPMCTLASLFAPVILSSEERRVLRKEMIPWALYAGYRAKFILNIYYEKHFERNIEDVRKQFGIIPVPVFT